MLDKFIENSIIEDIGDGDHTSLACIPENAKGKVKLLVKEDCIISGVEIAKKILQKFDKNLKIKIFIKDGSFVKKGDIIFTAEGSTQIILKAERLILNVMQRMSGISTLTNLYVQKIKNLNTKVLDTRKTTPNLRFIEKMAVKIGGGENHRMGLFDMIMIKDNHVDFAGGIKNAINLIKNYLKSINKNLKIEIEVRNLNELNEVLNFGGVDRIMLDNFSIKDTKIAVEKINKKYEVESSGGINLKTIRSYAECGVDFISVGALTHQIKSVDLSLKAIK